MNLTQLLAHFDRISEAPDAVPRLRRFIVDLAVRGKLVEQDQNDEPASELLKRIQAEKAQLTGGKAARALSPIDEAPFEAPRSWLWVRIRQVTSDRGQTTPIADFTYIDVTAINKEIGCISEAKVLSAAEAPSRARKVVHSGDVIYSCVRPYLLNIAVVPSGIAPLPIASTAFAVLNGFGLVLSKYLWIALRSPFMVEAVETKMRGQAYPAINDSDFGLLPLPLPPLAEQHRIVAKVDELMALCDQLEAAQADRESRRDRLVAASLNRLNQPVADASAFREHACFHFKHLPRLTARTEHVQQLRQTILDLGVRGQLVPQDPSDETAGVLLSRLVEQRRDKWESNQLAELAASHREPPKKWRERYVVPSHEVGLFGLPNTWVWASTREVCERVENGSTPPPNQMFHGEGDIPFIKVYNLTKTGAFDFTVRPTFISRTTHEKLLARSKVLPGDVLMNIVGPPLGKVSVVPNDFPEWNTNQAVVLFRPSSGLLTGYLAMCLLAEAVLRWITRTAQATVGQSNITVSNSRLLPIPLPPLAEQHRIVVKVDELMAVCDRLEAQLTTTQTESRRLLEAVLGEALNESRD